jgi:hypothetical protein
MLEYVLLSLYVLSVLILAFKRFPWALGFLIVVLPTYLVRLSFGPLPSTLLEVTFGTIVLVWLVRFAVNDVPFLGRHIFQHRYLWLGIGVFFTASLLGVAVSDMVLLSLGQWRAYFLEPIVLFVVIVARSRNLNRSDLVVPIVLSTLSISLYAIFQKISGIGIATPEWTMAATRRVTAFYTSPNAVALYLAPLTVLAGALALSWYKEKKKYVAIGAGLAGLAGLVAIVFTFSQGALIALAIGFVIFIALVGYKKTALALTACGVVGMVLILFFPSSLPVHYKSAGNRLILWSYSKTFLLRSPQNFVLGAGVRQFFRKIQKPYYDAKVMERLIYPHNIFLNFWTEIGLFGMLSFVYLYGYLLRAAYQKYCQKDKLWGGAFLIMLSIMFVHGLIDVPYFKNDLAMLFWVLVALVTLPLKEKN